MTINPEYSGTPGGNREPRPISSIIFENEMLLMKLSAEFGARVFLGEGNVQPEIQNHFLRSVYDFEKKVANLCEREIIYHRIGEPAYRKDEELSDEEVAVQLELLLKRMYQHRIVLDTLAEYSDRELYRFITNEFLHMEIDVFDAGEAILHFCYEDFYPNHDFDLRQASRYFTNYIMDLQKLLPQAGLYARVRTGGGLLVSYEDALETIQDSCAEFEKRNLVSFEIKQVNILEEVAFVDFEVVYDGKLPGGEILRVQGEGFFEFVYADECWSICFFEFPGVVL